MNFQARAPKIPPHILCIGIPVRDLTFRAEACPRAAPRRTPPISRRSAAATRSMPRLRSRGSAAAPRFADRWATPGRRRARFIFEQMAHEGIDTTHLDPHAGPGDADLGDHDRRDRRAHHRHVPRSGIVEGEAARRRRRCSTIATPFSSRAAARRSAPISAPRRVRRGIPVIVDVDRAMSLQRGPADGRRSHLVFSSEPLQETAGIADDGEALKKIAEADAVVPGRHPRPARHDLARRDRASCRRRRPSRSTPWIRSGPATSSTAPLRSPSPRSRSCGRRCASPRPPQR